MNQWRQKLSDEPIFDVSSAIESQRVNAFLVRLLLISCTVAFFDGFDQNVISFAAPTIAPALELTPSMMGNVFSIGLVGSILGGFLFGAIGDRWGRRTAIILATLSFSVLTLAVALASSYTDLLIMRLLVGIGTGGMLPVCWALNIECAPKRSRSSMVTLVMLGYSAGVSLGGPVALWLIPQYGWQSVFIFGGVLSLVATGMLIAMLPESIRFLTAQGGDPVAITKILRSMAPAMQIPVGARFVLSDEPPNAKRFSPALLFQGELRWITPMLWLATIFSSMAAFFLATWTPLVFEALQFSRSSAAAAGSITAIAGALGGLALMRFTDKHGAIAVAAMPALAIPLMVTGGLIDVSHAEFLVLIGFIAFALIGGHLGLNSIAGIFYPSAWRANGAGWANSVGKIGSVAGPLLGGAIMSTSLPIRNIFAVMAICPTVVLICLVVIGRIHSRILARERAMIRSHSETSNSGSW
jgi:AAHS family 4-hydroxybenzoate transporter-like MFS transporter